MLQRLLLLVEDDELIRYAYAAMLRHAGYAVLGAADGAEGITQARSHRPDLILLDLNMPRQDGWSTMRQLAADPELASIPVIAFTAQNFRGREQELTAAGFRAYLPKPAARTVLLDAVRRCLGGDPEPPPAPMPLPA